MLRPVADPKNELWVFLPYIFDTSGLPSRDHNMKLGLEVLGNYGLQLELCVNGCFRRRHIESEPRTRQQELTLMSLVPGAEEVG